MLDNFIRSNISKSGTLGMLLKIKSVYKKNIGEALWKIKNKSKIGWFLIIKIILAKSNKTKLLHQQNFFTEESNNS